MNVAPSLGRHLAGEGHSFEHAGDLDLTDAPDQEIIKAAREIGAVLLTHDLDFGRLLAFSGANKPSVIIFRGIDNHPQVLFHQLQRRWEDLVEPLAVGAIVILESEALRVRPLPIER